MISTHTSRRRPWQAWTLAGIQIFVAYQAISGGIGLITDTWQLPSQWLTRTPFTSWVGPGWVLIGLIAVPHLLAAVPPLFLPANPRLGILSGLLAGASLLIWIGLQLALLQVYFFLQPVIAATGIAELVVALLWHRRIGRPVRTAEAVRA